MARVFVTGGTGYLGRPTIRALIARGHEVRALVRPGSEAKLPMGAQPVSGNALDPDSFVDRVAAGDVFLQLVGTPKPSPAKAAEFERVDFASASASVRVASLRQVSHFVYLSVAQPAPVMQAYVGVRARVESLIADAKLRATCLRPWYVLGPGHRWPYALAPLYWLWGKLPTTRETARRLGLVSLDEMVSALVYAVESPPPSGVRVLDVPAIRRAALGAGAAEG
jgi:uncharacterized protein YbjT (DUF2867 family)